MKVADTKATPDCEHCRDVVALALSSAPRIQVTSIISVVKCPGCGALVLDDYLGWKGSGVIFRRTVDEILDYISKADSRPLAPELTEMIRAGLPHLAPNLRPDA